MKRSKLPVTKTAARHLLSKIRDYETEALERVRRNEPGLAPWQQTERCAAIVLSMLTGCLEFYAEPHL